MEFGYIRPLNFPIVSQASPELRLASSRMNSHTSLSFTHRNAFPTLAFPLSPLSDSHSLFLVDSNEGGYYTQNEDNLHSLNHILGI